MGRSARCVARAKAVTAPGFAAALTERPQHQRCDQHAGFGQRQIFDSFTRGGDGTRGDDRLAQSHHRPRPRDFSRAALGARCRLARTNTSTTACRSLLPASCCAALKRLAEQGMSSLVGLNRMVSAAGRG
jgi:hypothetical protein